MTPLRQRMLEDMQVRNLSPPNTQRAYVETVARFARHFGRSPADLGPEEKQPWSFDDLIPAPKKPRRLPVVLSPDEVVHALACVTALKHRAVLTTCDAAGLRVSEAVRLGSTDVDSRRMVLASSKAKGTAIGT
jgi:integrase/recombinase XerD